MTSPSSPVTLITGASRGIGQAIALQLSQRGHTVILSGRDLDGLAITQTLIREQGQEAHLLRADINDADQRCELITQIQQQYGRIDVLVNNAGVALDKWIKGSDVSLELCRQTFDTNVWACLHLCQLVLPSMREQGYGRIVNLSSELASLTEMQMGMTLAYRASKTTLNAITRILAIEHQDCDNIKINAAAPGWVKTDLGGDDAPLTPEQGADTPVWLACLPKNGPSGGFFRERELYPW